MLLSKLEGKWSPIFNALKMRPKPWRESRSRYFPSINRSSSLRRVTRSPKPKRHTRCSIVLLSAIRKFSGTRLSTKCIPRTPGIGVNGSSNKGICVHPGRRFWTASSSTSWPSFLLTPLRSSITTWHRRSRNPMSHGMPVNGSYGCL